MEHKMQLKARPFERMKSGKKKVELRLFDEKRRALCVGDYIIFTKMDTEEELCARITELKKFPDFFALYEQFDGVEMGYEEGEEVNAADMYAYYSQADIQRYGVLAICVEVTEGV